MVSKHSSHHKALIIHLIMLHHITNLSIHLIMASYHITSSRLETWVSRDPSKHVIKYNSTNKHIQKAFVEKKSYQIRTCECVIMVLK